MAPFATVSAVGFAAQRFIPGKGPLDCLVSHIIQTPTTPPSSR